MNKVEAEKYIRRLNCYRQAFSNDTYIYGVFCKAKGDHVTFMQAFGMAR